MIRAVVLLLLSLAACNKPSVDQCEQLCRRYADLKYRADTEASATAAGEEGAARIRKEREEKWASQQDDPVFLRNLDNCVTDCRQSADTGMVTCVEKAETPAAADACLEE